MIGITIHAFGDRLGNQLFQLATIIALAKSNNDTIAFPKWNYSEYFAGDFTPTDFTSKFQYKEYGVFDGYGFGYSPIPYIKDMSIYGYFQSEKHFIDQEDVIRDMFSPKFNVVRSLYERFITHKNDNRITETCAVHVRRGDYVEWPNQHPMIPIEWYQEAMSTFEDVHFYVFSDDVDWCIEAFPKAATIVTGQTDIQDFFMQQMCDNHIIANSSYSWWAAWLGEKRRVIAPKTWFGTDLHYNTKDLIPDRWEII